MESRILHDELDHVPNGFDLSFDMTRKPPTSDLLDQIAEGFSRIRKGLDEE